MHSRPGLPDPAIGASPVHRAADDLRRLVRALRLSSIAVEKEHGISGAQLFVLRALSDSSPASIAELAQATHTDPSSVSVVIRRLCARGLVRRSRSVADARRAHLELTAAGKKVLLISPKPIQVRLLAAMRALGKEDLAIFGRTLGRVLEHMGISDTAPAMFFEEDSRARAAAPAVTRRREGVARR